MLVGRGLSKAYTNDDGSEKVLFRDLDITIKVDLDGDGVFAGDLPGIADDETDPLDEDTDDDGLEDGDEVDVWSTDPLDVDSDADGLDDYEEVIDLDFLALFLHPCDEGPLLHGGRKSWHQNLCRHCVSSPYGSISRGHVGIELCGIGLGIGIGRKTDHHALRRVVDDLEGLPERVRGIGDAAKP